MDLVEIFVASKAIIDFNINEKTLLDNESFLMAWSIAKKKALENIQLVNILLLLKKKYKINEFEFQLLLENLDIDNLFL